MMQHHKYSLEEIENMLPWEREVYIGLLSKFLEDEKERLKKEQQQEDSQMADKITKTVDDEVAKKDINGDGHISKEELEMDLEFKRKELEDADARRDAMRKMTWFALMGMLVYPIGIVIADLIGYETTGQLLADIAPTYFVAISALVGCILWCKCVCR